MMDAGRERVSAKPAGAVSELLRCGGTQFDPKPYGIPCGAWDVEAYGLGRLA